MNTKPLNVLLLTIDALRYDFFRHDRQDLNPDAPALNRFAQENISFKNAFSCGPYTRFSFPSIFTSRYATKVTAVIDEVGVGLNPEAKTWVQALTASDFHTAGFTTNAYLSSFFGYQRGFDHYEDRRKPFLPILQENLPEIDDFFYKVQRKVMEKTFLSGYEVDSRYINQRFVEWLKMSRQPFFSWIHYMDVHSPYLNDRGLAHKAINNQLSTKEHQLLQVAYRRSVRHCDKSFQSLLNYLKRQNLLDKTIIILTADHGEEFNDHGEYFHKGKLYDELIHVPLVIRHPHLAKQEVDHLVSLRDLGPTILSLVGLNPEINWFPQHSFYNRKEVSFVDTRKRIYAEASSSFLKAAVRDKNYKYIFNERSNQEELYNLKDDPKEEHNLAKQEKDICQKLRNLLREEFKKRDNDL